jgi:hypothetical protein
MRQLLGMLVILSSAICAMLLNGEILMFVNTPAAMISLGILLTGFIFNDTKEIKYTTHLSRVFSSKELTQSEAENSAIFYSNMNKFSITASAITLFIAIIATLNHFENPKMLGPILSVTLLVTIYTGIVSTCFFIPATFKLLSSVPENSRINPQQSAAFSKAILGTILINAILILPWFLSAYFNFLTLPSFLFIAVALTGALVFVRNVRTSVLTRYLYSFLMSMALFLHLVSLVAILSYAPENTFTLLRVFGEALVPIVLAVIVIFPFSLLLNDILQDNKKTIMKLKLFSENNAFVKVYASIVGVTSVFFFLVLTVSVY